jgi:hypothetical protein
MTTSRQPTGVLVIRVWFEQDGLRARISRSLDVETSEQVVSVVRGAEEIQAAVARWLRQFIDPTGPATPM